MPIAANAAICGPSTLTVMFIVGASGSERGNCVWVVMVKVAHRSPCGMPLQWSAANRLTRRFELPAAQGPGGTPLPERDRTALLGRLLTDDHAPLRTRVAAVILLLYAQSVSRITRLTIDDVIRDGDQVLLRLGNPPSPVSEPAAAPANRSSPARCRR